jgi:hypothetical protein
MASLATSWTEHESVAPAAAQREKSQSIQSFPGEEIYFWTKKIDNASVDPRHDPAFLKRLWRLVTVAMFVLVFGLGYAVPIVTRSVVNMEIRKLEQEIAAAEKLHETLSVEYAKKRTPASLEQSAGSYIHVDPKLEVRVPPSPDGSLAMGRIAPSEPR